jgi:hypothetical protein
MTETWVYHKDRKTQHAVSRWGYWGVDLKCGIGTSHTLLEPCREGQDICPTCARGIDAWRGAAGNLRRDAQPPGVPQDTGCPNHAEVVARCLADEKIGTYIPPGTDVTLVDDDWE